ncbi:MAG: hypothetical protein QHH10_01980 [Peptococcaceae bacterium]|jgi:DNA-binding NarL/FixJ family response regulator|nr:hypothetical protein [Peptococcaceae bacterium]MDH7524066.1 hypothetical protein [Peptococcaceae bacterium]
MNSLDVIIFFINIILLVYITYKINSLRSSLLHYRQIEENVAAMIDKHLQLADLVLEELEGKINQAGAVLSPGMENEQAAAEEEKERQDDHAATMNKKRSSRNESSAKIIRLRQQGFSVQEIAERLSISQGEISLKLNLHEKLAAGQLKNNS